MESIARPLDVAIVGGGLAGLATGYELSRRAPESHWRLFEASDRIGGKIRTDRIETDVGEFVVEAGPDAFLSQKPWARELAVELGLGGRLVQIADLPSPVAILKRGRRIDLPADIGLVAPIKIGPFVRSSLFSWPGKLRVGLDLLLPPRPPGGEDDDESIASFVRRRLGNEALDWLAEPLVAGIYNADPNQLSLDATFPQWRAMEREHGSLIRGLRAASPPGDGPKTPAFLTFRGGMAELTDELAARVGVPILTGTPVRAIERSHNGRFALRLDSGAIEAAAIVLATPAMTAANLLSELATQVSMRLRTFHSASSGAISFAFRDEQIRRPLSGYGLVIPKREGLPFNAITVASRKFPGRAPSGWTLLRVFAGGFRSPETLRLDDDALTAMVMDQLRQLLGVEGKPLLARIQRWPEGSPQYGVGHRQRVREAEDALPAGVFLTGSAYRGVGIPDIVRDAREQAANALAFLEGREPQRHHRQLAIGVSR